MSKGKVLKPKRGYHLKKHGRRVMLMRGGLGIATITCACRGEGGCGIVIDTRNGTATCEGECSEGCRWVVTELGGLVGQLAIE